MPASDAVAVCLTSEAGEFGIHTGEVEFDFAAVMARVRRVTDYGISSYEHAIEHDEVWRYSGAASVSSPRTRSSARVASSGSTTP